MPRSKHSRSEAPKALPPEEMEDSAGPRALWSGTVSFGLVTIPVDILPASRSVRSSLRMLGPDGTPLSRRFFCPKQDKPLEWEEIVRGYETDKGKFVVVTDDELDALAPKQSRDIDVSRFVDRDALDPMFFERSYFLVPASDTNTSYRLLAETMQRTKKAGIASFVMRGKQYLVAIVVDHGILRADIMRFAEELRTPKDVGLPKAAKPNARSLKTMKSAIKRLVRPRLSDSELEDHYWQRLTQFAERKHKKHRDVVTPEVPEEESGADIIDLMDALKQSLRPANEGARSSRKRSTRKRAASKQPRSRHKSRAKTRSTRKHSHAA